MAGKASNVRQVGGEMATLSLDDLVLSVDRALRTVFAPSAPERPMPGQGLPEAVLDPVERKHAAGLMRVNHVGEICAQALYQGQAAGSSNAAVSRALAQAAREETDHLAWTESRIGALGGRKSLLNPLWYGGAFALGVLAARFGDGWNLGFLAETERQVEAHLDGHLQRLPASDEKSRQVLLQMRSDEIRHAETAVRLGAEELPLFARLAMKAASRVMTSVAYYV